MRRTAGTVLAVLAFVVALLAAAAPAGAIVGGVRADAPRAGIGSWQYFRDGHPDWGTCSAHALRTDEDGLTDLLVTGSQCVTVMPGPQSQQVRSMTDEGKARYAQFRAAAEKAGRTAASPERADRPAPGLQSTPEDPATFRFVFNSANRFQGERVGVKRFLVPKEWDWGEKDKRGYVWDLSLVQLEHPIRVKGAIVAPVLDWKTVTTQGWGRDTADPGTWKGPLGPWLRQTDGRVTAHADCAGAGIGADEVCVAPGRNAGAACQGDSGGGGSQELFGTDVLTMLVSRGPQPYCGTVNVYSSIWAHGRWIAEQVRALEPQARVAAVSQSDLRRAAAQHHAAVPAQPDFALAG
ncbi:trypsin-like serine protease [Amycolatopsis rubida]|uniref:Trypsin n=1 Tax=Amycolatopsis rubida TaxID=112413 RepID=A0A1I5XB78_9PSEU|nr:trypsin-like serine protease [Amycolatopsis rubida]SFQ29232.1 Trypsin [Amycolatopsis rubida]